MWRDLNTMFMCFLGQFSFRLSEREIPVSEYKVLKFEISSMKKVGVDFHHVHFINFHIS